MTQRSEDIRAEKENGRKERSRASWTPAAHLSLGGRVPEGARVRYCRKGKENLERKLEEGWVFVHKDEEGVFIEGGTDIEGAVMKHDVVLMMMPEEMAKARAEYFQNKAKEQTVAQALKEGKLQEADDFQKDAAAAQLKTHGEIIETVMK